MPLHKEEHGHQVTSAFLWGLLPDDPRVVEFWARQHGIARTDAAALLAHVGEDCAGAVQIVAPERLSDVRGASTQADQQRSVEWLSPNEIAELLSALRRNPAAGRSSSEQGQFSLAGAQPKTTLYYEGGKWGVPMGRVPSTHILKPPVLDLADLAYNEHACLQLARELGFPTAHSTVQRFGDEIAIVVERYDRIRVGGVVTRVHQEEANVLNWFLAAPDAHAKNYSMLHAPGSAHRLSPLYDVITALPYPSMSVAGVTLAMAIDGERRVASVTGKHWRAVANAVELPPHALLDRIAELGESVPAAIDRVLGHYGGDAETREIVSRLMSPIGPHVARCLKQL